jgi:hypothetical protein
MNPINIFEGFCTFCENQSMALKATPDGVHIRAFNGVKYEGINLAQPKQVAVAMKEELFSISYHAFQRVPVGNN